MHANSTDTTSTPYRTHMSPSYGTGIAILPVGVSPFLLFLQLNTLLIPHHSRYEDSVLCLTRFDAHGVKPSTLAIGDYKTLSSLRLYATPYPGTVMQSGSDADARGPRTEARTGLVACSRCRLDWLLAAGSIQDSNATTLPGGINCPGKLSERWRLGKIQIHDECPGEEATKDPVDRSDLLSTDSIRIPAKYVPRTRHARVEMELVLSSHQDELHGYNSHRKVPKERQITQKDGSYDIDPGKSPTKASSR
ncbi:hypothetical protein BA78_4116 [Aspergillus fumigatus]|nr:hypothetical protein BA78_4116 [Aspergillus fumigatus]